MDSFKLFWCTCFNWFSSWSLIEGKEHCMQNALKETHSSKLKSPLSVACPNKSSLCRPPLGMKMRSTEGPSQRTNLWHSRRWEQIPTGHCGMAHCRALIYSHKSIHYNSNPFSFFVVSCLHCYHNACSWFTDRGGNHPKISHPLGCRCFLHEQGGTPSQGRCAEWRN